jgi:type IV pilus assembly protein PilE
MSAFKHQHHRFWVMNMKKQSGFSLVELLITIAILGILVAIAVPNYRAQVIRGARTEAVDEILKVAQFQQQTFTRTNQFAVPAVNPYTTQNGRYQITTQVNNAGQSYTITAAPQGGQANDPCGSLILDEVGRKTTTAGDAANCWGGR